VALLEHTFRWRHAHLHTFGSPPKDACTDIAIVMGLLVVLSWWTPLPYTLESRKDSFNVDFNKRTKCSSRRLTDDWPYTHYTTTVDWRLTSSSNLWPSSRFHLSKRAGLIKVDLLFSVFPAACLLRFRRAV